MALAIVLFIYFSMAWICIWRTILDVFNVLEYINYCSDDIVAMRVFCEPLIGLLRFVNRLHYIL